MQRHKLRKARVHRIDRLRTRIWIAQAMNHSGALTPHSFWLEVDKKKSSRSRWYNYLSGGTVPRNDIVSRIETEVPGTAKVFNALFWSVLKGLPVTHEQVSTELNALTKVYTGPHKLMQMDFWMSAIEVGPDQFEAPATQTILESRSGEELIQVTILILALADSTGNNKLWNYICRTYRKFLPLYIPTIPWAFKDKVFDELDKYVQERTHSGVSLKSHDEDWRDTKPKVRACVIDEYSHILHMALLDSSINSQLLPEGFTQQLAEKLANEFCKSEDKMLYSWHLCDPISLDIAETVADILLREEGAITVDRIMRYLNSLGYFDDTCLGHEAFTKFTHIQKYHLNFFP